MSLGDMTRRLMRLFAARDAQREREREKIAALDLHTPGWREHRYGNGQRVFADDGTMLDEKGNRSIFDDVDE
jgi:hypothetical protein